MKILNDYYSLKSTQHGFTADTEHEGKFQVDVLESWLLRVAVIPSQGFTVDRTWMIAPQGNSPWQGHPKLVTQGFACPEASCSMDNGVVLETPLLKFHLPRQSLQIKIEQRYQDRWVPAFQDLKTGAYSLTDHGHGVRHYQMNSNDVRHFGLGDKAGPLDRTGRRFRILQLDALGYDAENSDPLYKHIPFMILQDRTNGTALGLLYDSMSEMVFDLGCEHSNYHPRYRYVETQERGLVYYVIAGPRIADVVRRLTELTGKPHFQPRWTLGFAFTSMGVFDDPHAQDVVSQLAERFRSEKIPISAIHFGSGYTTNDRGLRYVFTWNTSSFPNKAKLFQRLKQMGLYTVANTKPVLLTDHPSYSKLADQAGLIKRENATPAVEQFWDAHGSNIDFTSEAGRYWWQAGAKAEVLDAGFDSIWNDNNETEVWDEDAFVDGFGQSIPALATRPLQSLLMTRASFEATERHAPQQRPYTITRAGMMGIQRYAETWTGDNWTSWHTLKWNLRNGISLGLSGIPIIGHDVGGFTGPAADPELLVRWVQMMALHPRCVMNSWKPESENPTNFPWMHSSVTDLVREALHLRYRFIPYLYTLAYLAHQTGDPIIRPLFYDYDEEPCYEEHDAFLLGKHVLIAPVVEPGKHQVSVYLPQSPDGWYDYYTEQWYAGGQWIELKAELGRLPIVVKAGTVLPLALEWDAQSPHDAKCLGLTVYAPVTTTPAHNSFFYDDGLTWRYQKNSKAVTEFTVISSVAEVSLWVKNWPALSNLTPPTVRFVGRDQRHSVIHGI